ncbi:uncharacterized protein LOC144710386 isoform X1 [Wolffia australiana]
MASRLRPGLPSFRCFCILDALGADSDGYWGLGCIVLRVPCLLWDDPSVSSAAKECVGPFSVWFGFGGRSDVGTGLNWRRLVLNELRAGMISFSLAPANAAILFILIQGGTTGI